MEKPNDFLNRIKFNPSKKMGQNFLINENVVNNIINTIDFNNVDLIIEIGPGTGALTNKLVDKNIRLITIEIDKRLGEYIQNNYKQHKNFEIIIEDALKVDLDKICNGYKNPIIVSNLPYSISSVLLFKFLKSNINLMYCMLQKEMVDRICAKPKTKDYNNFTVILQTMSKITRLLEISKKEFKPAPEVDSSFIKIEKIRKYDPNFDKFVKSCFLARRRTFINNLKYTNTNLVKEYISKHNFSLTCRAEELNVEDFIELYKLLFNKTL